MEGILNIDKPQWLSSHDAVVRVRRICGTRRVGHAGTLDPLATGVLLVCVGRATRLSEYLMGHQKTYTATVRLGQTTNTYDAEGEVKEERPFAHISQPDIEESLTAFRGSIEQLPPLYSALKVKGQPMYKLARQGKEVARKPRLITIYELNLLDWTPPFLQLNVVCAAGTYIRSLAHDIGERLGCGGHITELRRTAVGNFNSSDAVSLENLTAHNWQSFCYPGDQAISYLPKLDASEAEVTALLLGQQIPISPQHPTETLVRVYNPNNQFFGILLREKDVWQPKKMFPPETEKIG
ncbi:MAG: tRNA pseudouridine(55) synthase TruB [Chloroflexi bacterium]|nr:MAG: tRNA pseudouridine(55) synthase TruB [Chloroflexota bacterium]